MQTGQPARREPLADKVVAYLLDYTRRHRLACGAPVPSEASVSSTLNVSRGVVREAYRSLKGAGILDIANGRAPRLGRIDRRAVTAVLQHALATQQATAAQILDVRRALEVRAAELAAVNRADADVRALEREVEAMRRALSQRRRFVDADIRFHEVIGRATGNPLYDLLSRALRDVLSVTIRTGFDSPRSMPLRGAVVRLHAGIAGAIAARRPAEARRLMQEHFDAVRTFIIDADEPPLSVEPGAGRRRARIRRSASG